MEWREIGILKTISRSVFSFCLMTLIICHHAIGQVIPQYKNFSGVFPSASNIPFGAAVNGVRCQQLFPVGAFNTTSGLPPEGRQITKVYWEANSMASGSAVYLKIEIYLKQENISLMTGIYRSGMTMVYSSTYDTINLTGGSWFGFELQSPFIYDPSLPLICEVRNIQITSNSVMVNTAINVSGAARIYEQNFNSSSAAFSVSSVMTGFGFDLERTSYAGNDIGITAIDSPTVFCEGQQPLYARVQNFGINQVDSFTVNWSVNGVLQSPVTCMNTLDTFNGSRPSFAYVNLGSLQFFQGQSEKIMVWTSLPNNKVDTIPDNDSSYTSKTSSMHGLYKIDASGSPGSHYRNVADFANDLSKYGVCGLVRAEISAGNYPGRVLFNSIRGSGLANPIEIIGDSTGSVTITPGSYSSTHNYVMKISACRAMDIRNITLKADSAQVSVVMEIADGSRNIEFKKCNFIGKIFPSLTGNQILFYSNTYGNHQIAIRESEFQGGLVGLSFSGYSASATNNDLVVSGNIFLQQYFTGMSIFYSQNPKLLNNRIYSSGLAYSAIMYGIEVSNAYGKSEILSNEINIEGSHGIYIVNTESTINFKPVIANNFIRVGRNSFPAGFGLYITNSSNLMIVHNTIVTDFRDYAFHSIYLNGGGNTLLNNNVYEVRGFAGASCLSIVGLYSVIQSDYNNFYTKRHIGYLAGLYSSLPAWQNATGYDMHSITTDPAYVNLDSLRTCSDSLDGAGIPVDIVSTDFDGDARHKTSPDIGADEWVGSGAGAYEAGQDTFLCSGKSVVLGVPVSGGIFNWSNGDSTSTTTVAEEGRYIVNMTSVCGSSHSDTVHVSDLTPVPSFGMKTTFQTVELDNNAVNAESNMWVIQANPPDTFYSEDLVYLFKDNGPHRIDLHIYNKCDSVVGSQEWTGHVVVSDIGNAAGVLLYPNPATDKLTIKTNEMSGILKATLINVISGIENTYICTKNEFEKQDLILDVSALPRGCYILRMEDDNLLIVNKIILR